MKYDKQTSLIDLYLKYPDTEKLITRLKNIETLEIIKYDAKNITAEYVRQ